MLKPDSPQRFDDREQAVTIKIPVIGLAIVLSLLLGAVAGVVAYRYRSSTRHAGSAQQAPPAKGTAPEKPLLRRADPQIVNGSMEVTLTLDQAVPYDAHRLEHPDRVYVDLHDARLAPELSGKTLFVNSGGVSDIRLAQTQSDTVRVVLDLEKRFDFSVNAVSDPHSLVIKLTPPPAKHSKKRRETKKPSGTSAITREGIGLAWL
jgi:hypothetical protein